MAEHRVPMLAASRRFPDPETSTDPAVRGVLTTLRTLEIAPAPRAHFRAELRAQLVAVAPRLVAEGEPVAEATPAKRQLRHVADSLHAANEVRESKDVVSRVRRHRFAKPLAVLAAACVVLGLLLGGAVWISKGALPGDALYGLKRASENAELSLSSGNDRGKTLLKFARTRTNEVLELLGQPTAAALSDGPNADGGISGDTAKQVRTTLDSADSDTRDAAKLLGTASVRDDSAAPLNAITSWAPGQQNRFDKILAHVPAGSLHDRAAASARLFQQAVQRAKTLQAMVGCPSLDAAPTDALGPVPPANCQLPSSTSGKPGTSHPTPAATHGTQGTTTKPATPNSGTGKPATTAPATAGGGTDPAPNATTGTRPAPAGTSAPRKTGLPVVPLPTDLPLPTTVLPTVLPTDPIGAVTSAVGGLIGGVNGAVSSVLAPPPAGSAEGPLVLSSCSVGVHVGVLNVNLGSCPAD